MAGAGIIWTGPRTRNFIKMVDGDDDSVVVTVAGASTAAAKWTAIEAECPATVTATGGEISNATTDMPSFYGTPNQEEVNVFASNQAVSRPRQLSAQQITITVALFNPGDTLHAALVAAGQGQRINVTSVLIGDDVAGGGLQTVAGTAKATAIAMFGYLNVARIGDQNANGDAPLEIVCNVRSRTPLVNQA